MSGASGICKQVPGEDRFTLTCRSSIPFTIARPHHHLSSAPIILPIMPIIHPTTHPHPITTSTPSPPNPVSFFFLFFFLLFFFSSFPRSHHNLHPLFHISHPLLCRALAPGLFTDLYYIREGQKNDYALQFQVPVSPNISVLYFNWQNLGKTPIAYSVGLQASEMHILDESNINIRKEGEVPFKEQVIRISMPCQPCVTSEVDVNILFNFSFPLKSGSNLTTLSLKRKKVCVAKLPPSQCSQAFPARKKHLTSSLSSTLSSSSESSEATNLATSLSTSILRSDTQSSALALVIGFAAAFTFLVVFILLMCTRRSSDASKETSVLTRHVDAQSAGFSRASSDFSLKKMPAPESCRSFARPGDIDGIWFL